MLKTQKTRFSPVEDFNTHVTAISLLIPAEKDKKISKFLQQEVCPFSR